MYRLVEYLGAAAKFVSSMIHQSNQFWKYGICPFQFDMVVAMGEAQRKERHNDYDEESDDEEETEDDEPYTDFVGNVTDKLVANNLKYSMEKSSEARRIRIFNMMYKTFKAQHHDHGVQDTDERGYMQNKRLIALVDMRPDEVETDEKNDSQQKPNPQTKQVKKERDGKSLKSVCHFSGRS